MKNHRYFLLWLIVLMLASLACSLTGTEDKSPTSTKRSRPAQEPVATAEVVTEEVLLTEEVLATAEPFPVTMRLALVSLESLEPSGGWQSYTARFALENISGGWQPVTVDSGPGSVQTEEGYTYPLDPLHYDRMVPILYGDPLTIPDGFIIQGSSDDINGFENVLEVFFQVAEGSHPTYITYQNFGTIDLSNAESLEFPTSKPREEFPTLGNFYNLEGIARLTVTGVRRTEYGIYQGLAVDMTYENLDPGYDTSVQMGCFLVDSWGFIRWNKANTNFSAGPGQTVETSLGFYLWEPERAFTGSWDLNETAAVGLLTDAKLICRGDIDWVLHLPYIPLAEASPTEAPVVEVPATEVPSSSIRPLVFLEGETVIFNNMGTQSGPDWLVGNTSDGTVSLVEALEPYGQPGTRWRVHALGHNTMAFESLDHLEGPRWLDGHTGDGTVSLAPQIDGYSGTLWRAYVTENANIILQCLGDIDGPRWLDGRTGDGTVGLAWEVDVAHSGAQWRILPSALLFYEMMPDTTTEAYAIAVTNGWQGAAELLLSQMTTQVTYTPFDGEPDRVTYEDDQMIKSIMGEKERIEVKPDHCAIWWGSGGENTGPRFSARQDWQLVQGPGDALEGYGMMVRADGTAHYQFDVRDNEQQIGLEYWLNGQMETLQDWTYTDALRPGQVNRLGVVADGGHFYFLVNGIVVAELYDDRIPDGAMGSYFNTCDPDGWTIYETDNFELRK